MGDVGGSIEVGHLRLDMAARTAAVGDQSLLLTRKEFDLLALLAARAGITAAFLASPLASGITGTVVYVDKGYHAMGMASPD